MLTRLTAHGLGAALRDFFGRVFAERQIYLRSQGQVQFVSLSPFTQASLCGAALALFSWVAFTSAQVVFKDHFATAEERRLAATAERFQGQLAEMQLAYHSLQESLASVEDDFDVAASRLEAQHSRIAALVGSTGMGDEVLTPLRRKLSEEQGLGSSGPRKEARRNDVLMAPGAMAAAQGHSRAAASASGVPSGGPEAAYGRLDDLALAQSELVTTLEERADKRIRELEAIIRETGVTKALRSSPAGTGPSGGPFVAADGLASTLEPDEDPAFARQLKRVSTKLERISSLTTSLARLPLSEPLSGEYRSTSGFGPRLDPFSRRVAFHSGHDFAASTGTTVRAPAEGRVSFAGWKGAYGRMIEIDHGSGVKTRYGHLRRIKVAVGDKVGFRDAIGAVGSSGRSTGPHLHYEVFVDGKAVDPVTFIEAGRHVFQR